MINYETEQFNNFSKLLCPNADFDAQYTFYYDETNNIKKLHLNKGNFNVAFSSNFVLGGLAYMGAKPDVSDIFEGLNLQANTNEVKLKHLAFGDFMDCLTSRKLTLFLEYVLKAPLYLHFSTLNLLYYSIVDIVDSAIAGAGETIEENTPGAIRYLKNDLYKLCRLEIEKVVPLFVRYGYPDIKKEELNNFAIELLGLFKNYEDVEEYRNGLFALEALLEKALANGGLPFIIDEKSLMLVNGLVHLYLRPIYTFLNSEHRFDNETEIQTAISEFNITYKDKEITNYSFLESKDDFLIQASDIIIGFVGKLSKFFNTHTAKEIEQQLLLMTDVQTKNLNLYLDIVLKSENLNPGFFHYIDSNDDHLKNKLLFDLRENIDKNLG